MKPTFLVEGGTMRMRSKFENKLTKIRYNFLGIRQKNLNFVLCQFQRFKLYYKKYFEFNSHKMKFMFLSPIPRKL